LLLLVSPPLDTDAAADRAVATAAAV